MPNEEDMFPVNLNGHNILWQSSGCQNGHLTGIVCRCGTYLPPSGV